MVQHVVLPSLLHTEADSDKFLIIYQSYTETIISVCHCVHMLEANSKPYFGQQLFGDPLSTPCHCLGMRSGLGTTLVISELNSARKPRLHHTAHTDSSSRSTSSTSTDHLPRRRHSFQRTSKGMRAQPHPNHSCTAPQSSALHCILRPPLSPTLFQNSGRLHYTGP